MIAQSQGRELKAQQSQLSTELASGETSRPLSHLRGDVTILTDVTRTQALTKQYLQTTAETDFLFQRAQSTLSAVKDTATTFIDSLLTSQESGLPQAKGLVVTEASSAFSSMVSRLNEAAAGRHLFSGQATDTAPLLSSDDFKAQVDAALLGATSAAEVNTRLDAFFASGGAFETLVYQGSTEALDAIDVFDSISVKMDMRAV
jgi:flagellar hook-associated protein 3 FlgL